MRGAHREIRRGLALPSGKAQLLVGTRSHRLRRRDRKQTRTFVAKRALIVKTRTKIGSRSRARRWAPVDSHARAPESKELLVRCFGVSRTKSASTSRRDHVAAGSAARGDMPATVRGALIETIEAEFQALPKRSIARWSICTSCAHDVHGSLSAEGKHSSRTV